MTQQLPTPISVKPDGDDEADIEAGLPRSKSLLTIVNGNSTNPTKPTLKCDSSITAEGALAEGGPVNIWECQNMGFIMQYFAVGIIYGGLPACSYGLFLGYLNVPGYVYTTAGVISTLPWSFKFAFGMLNDCRPIFGYRRKPYMVIGWALCAAMLVFLYTHTLPEPYFQRNDHGDYIKKNSSAADGSGLATPGNPSAREKGGEYALLMCLAALGYVVADVAADGMMVEIARREPLEQRGATQTSIYMVRSIGMIFSIALVGFCMNGKEYQGTFDWTLSFNQICLILACPAAVMVPCSWFLVQETRITAADAAVSEVKSFGDYWQQCWEMMSSKAFFFVVLFNFFEPFVGRISTPAGGYVKKEWAGVQNIQNQMFSLVSTMVFAGGLWLVKKYLLNYDWRKMLAATLIFLNATDLVIVYCTVYGVVRNQYFYLGEQILDDIPAAANFVVGTYIIVEMADEGNEGLTYGLLTTISNLGSPFARAIGNQIFGVFKPDLSNVENFVRDTPHFRDVVAASFGLSYFFSFAALTFLLLLPRQKAEAQQRKRDWPKNSRYAYITCAILFCALIYSLTVNFMAMFPSTMCLKFAGGQGC